MKQPTRQMLQKQLDQALARVEELEARDSQWADVMHAEQTRGANTVDALDAAEQKLAAATALLRDHQHLATVHYTNAGCDLAHRTEVFLSGQPAAPRGAK